MKNDVGRYFIGLVPPSPVLDEALELKNYVKSQFHSKAALRSPPHITLHMPFDWKEKKVNALCEKLSDFSKTQPSFRLQLSDFSCFPPRVIFIQVLPNEALTVLQKLLHTFCKVHLNLFNAQYQDQPYHPHLTIAFRDLKKEAFGKAWDEFKNRRYSAAFDVCQITLFKHDGKKWESFCDFSLASSQS